ncbi:MAG: hypothetical protein IT434_12880 [Phycisphaerales bacterium]|nr:hypothetical protein [Phycisphaerales bacterium]
MTSTSTSRPPQPVLARLPMAPRNASPVPHLTSLYHFESTGGFGSRSYPGNCGGLLIRDLLLYFKAARVLDPMSGSGTCGQVCRSLGIPFKSGDIHRGFDATDPASYRYLRGRFDFVWAHPPYWRQKIYADDPRDLSRAPTLDAFLDRYAAFISASAAVLSSGGHFAILMGDYTDRQIGFVPLTFHTKRFAYHAGLVSACTDIIRFSHGNSSSSKVYQSSFIPGLHDVCMIFRKPHKHRPPNTRPHRSPTHGDRTHGR